VRKSLFDVALRSNPDSNLMSHLKQRFHYEPQLLDEALDGLAGNVYSAGVPRVVALRALVRAVVQGGVTWSGSAQATLEKSLKPLGKAVSPREAVIGAAAARERTAGSKRATAAPKSPVVAGNVLLQAVGDASQGASGAAPADRFDRAWGSFVADPNIDPHFLFDFEKYPIKCTDSGATLNGQPVSAIETTATVPVPFDKLKNYADPQNWPDICPYFEGLHPLGTGQPTGNTWAATFCEDVEFIDGRVLHTPLQYLYNADNADPITDELWTTYELLAPTEWLDVDQGYVHVSAAPAGNTTIETLKLVHFIDPVFQAWTSLACETVWGELFAEMVLRAATDP
jgi:hypothetical protein